MTTPQDKQAQEAVAVPLAELLRGVPQSARLEINDGPYSTRYIPVGRYCHEAAAALSQGKQQAEGEGWISVDERLPESEDPVLIYTPDGQYGKVWIDCWRMQSEAPLSFSSATIETGFMWDEHEFEEVSHWMPLPKAPAALATTAQGGEYGNPR